MKKCPFIGGVSSNIQGMEPSGEGEEKGEDDPWIPSVGGACFCEVCTQLQSRKPKS
jgi:hypothetical protein